MHFGLPPLPELIQSVGYVGVWLIVFAESCLVFFLPGDSLLFVAGFLASQPQFHFNIWLLASGCLVGAVAGNSTGYAVGYRLGRRLFNREDSWLFRPQHLDSAHQFYAKHGKKALVLARFVPAVRTFAPIVAGMGTMQYRTFLTYNFAGGALWTFGLTLLGYFLGQFIDPTLMERYLILIVVGIVLLSLLPAALHVYQERRAKG